MKYKPTSADLHNLGFQWCEITKVYRRSIPGIWRELQIQLLGRRKYEIELCAVSYSGDDKHRLFKGKCGSLKVLRAIVESEAPPLPVHPLVWPNPVDVTKVVTTAIVEDEKGLMFEQIVLPPVSPLVQEIMNGRYGDYKPRS